MASWSQQRKFIYGGTTALVILAVAGLFSYKVFYVAPSCSDGRQNGTEKGVDCGGTCVKLCLSAFYTPNIAWTRLEEVAPGLYNVAAYVINPNPNAGAVNVPYHVTLYDNDVSEITSYNGLLTIPPHRNTLAFAGAVSTGKRIPVKALFQFSAAPNWVVEQDPIALLAIGDKKFSDDGVSSYLSVTLKNTVVKQLGRMSVYAILFDKDQNTLGFSKTIIDGISSLGTVVAPFTWPTVWKDKVISIEVLPVSE
jgi:hypothetical protein